MGLGHHRAIYPLVQSLKSPLICIGENDNSPKKEQKRWKSVLKKYELVSRLQTLPIISYPIKAVMNIILNIEPEKSSKDLSIPTLQTRYMHRLLKKKQVCNGVVDCLKENPNDILITSFYASALAASYINHKPVFLIICDTDINRVWVPFDPARSNITYFVPSHTVLKRLVKYGVNLNNIKLTGFPLPLSLIGSRNKEILKSNLADRLYRLDRNSMVKEALSNKLVDNNICCNPNLDDKIHITFSIGGAGAQKELAINILMALHQEIINNKIVFNILVGTHVEVYLFFCEKTLQYNENQVKIGFKHSVEEYLDLFNQTIARTDILITKPSELTFYAGLGLPIIMTQPIGKHEEFNRKWLIEKGGGVPLPKLDVLREWFSYKLNSGFFALMSWNAYNNIENMGTYKIMDIVQEYE